MSQRLSLLAILFIFLAGLSGCNTIQGAGEDIEEAGETIEEGADQ